MNPQGPQLTRLTNESSSRHRESHCGTPASPRPFRKLIQGEAAMVEVTTDQRPYRLEMELQVTVRYHVGSRNQTLSPAKGPRCLCTRIQEFTQPLHHGASERKVTDALMLAGELPWESSLQRTTERSWGWQCMTVT